MSEYTIPARHAASNEMNPTAIDGIPRYNPVYCDAMNGTVSSTMNSASRTDRVLNQNPTNTQRYIIPQIRMIGLPIIVYAPGTSAVIFVIPKWEVITLRSGSPYDGTGNGVIAGIAAVLSFPQPVVSQALK